LDALRAAQGVAGAAAAPAGPVAAAAHTPEQRRDQTESNVEDTAALERALVLQGGGVLPAKAVEAEPGVFYVYDSPAGGERRDTFGTALTVRLGLPFAAQADLSLPYVLRDDWTRHGVSAGIGDVRLGLTKRLFGKAEQATAVFVRGEWRLPTGDVKKTPPTGFGQHGLRVELTATAQQEPFVFFGNLSYAWNLGTAHLADGTRLDTGDVVGGRIGAVLAATPDVSLVGALSFHSTGRDRLAGGLVSATDRARGALELGATTILGRNLFLDLDAEIGITRDAPDLAVSVSLPYRF
jgi:hypothetical protein